MRINTSVAVESLRFNETCSDIHNDVNQAFDRRIELQIDSLIEKIRLPDPVLFATIQNKANLVNSEGLDRIRRVPSLISRLVAPQNYQITDTGAYLLQLLDAELARENGYFETDKYQRLWSGLGDFMICYDAVNQSFDEYHAFLLNDRIVMDYFSPNCLAITNEELGDEPGKPISEYSYEEAIELSTQLEDTLMPLADEMPGALHLICAFTSGLILKRQQTNQPNYFSSASNFPFIGRCLLINADRVNGSQVVDALVHEATHSLMYKIDVVNKWMPSNAIINKFGTVISSPWTGRMLSLGNFLQAIFVWYGLFNFWKQAKGMNIYSLEYGSMRLEQIRRGFGQMDISEVNRRFDGCLEQELIHSAEAIRQYITAA